MSTTDHPPASVPTPLQIIPAGHWLDVCGPAGQSVFEIPKSRRDMAEFIVKACNENAALVAELTTLKGAISPHLPLMDWGSRKYFERLLK
jgi:hypothetical protein